MTKQELIARVYELELARRAAMRRPRSNGSGDLTRKDIAEIVDSVFAEVADYFVRTKLGADRDGRKSGVRFTYPGFGTFTKRRRPARPGRNPRTGEVVPIPPTITVSFTVGSELKSELNVPPPSRGKKRG